MNNNLRLYTQGSGTEYFHLDLVGDPDSAQILERELNVLRTQAALAVRGAMGSAHLQKASASPNTPLTKGVVVSAQAQSDWH